MVTLPRDAMCRVLMTRSRSITECIEIYQWLAERGLSKSTSRQFKDGLLVALVFDRSQDAVVFKLTFGGTV